MDSIRRNECKMDIVHFYIMSCFCSTSLFFQMRFKWKTGKTSLLNPISNQSASLSVLLNKIALMKSWVYKSPKDLVIANHIWQNPQLRHPRNWIVSGSCQKCHHIFRCASTSWFHVGPELGQVVPPDGKVRQTHRSKLLIALLDV